MFLAGIETWLILRQSDILPRIYHHSQHKLKNFFRIYLRLRLSATGVLNSWEQICIYAYVVAGNSLLECSTHCGERVYCHPPTDCFVGSQLISVARYRSGSIIVSNDRVIRNCVDMITQSWSPPQKRGRPIETEKKGKQRKNKYST